MRRECRMYYPYSPQASEVRTSNTWFPVFKDQTPTIELSVPLKRWLSFISIPEASCAEWTKKKIHKKNRLQMSTSTLFHMYNIRLVHVSRLCFLLATTQYLLKLILATGWEFEHIHSDLSSVIMCVNRKSLCRDYYFVISRLWKFSNIPNFVAIWATFSFGRYGNLCCG